MAKRGTKPVVAVLAADLCRRFPETANRTLARKLYEANKELLTRNAAELAIRRVRRKQGAKNRSFKESTYVGRSSKPSISPQCPPSAAEPWLPVEIDGPCRVLSLSDIHIPYHSAEAVESAIKYGRKFKPDVVLLNGDVLDFYRGSRFQHDPKKRTLTQEIQDGKQFLAWLRSQFPKARIIYKLGNHDERWNVFVWNRAPEVFDLPQMQLNNILEFETHNIELVGDNAVMLGSLPVLHGHELGRSGIANPVNPARGAFLRAKHTVLIGHLHQTSGHGESDMWHKETFCWSQGALCDLTPEYARINRWNHGFATVEVTKDGEFDLTNLRMSGDYKVRTA